MTGWGRPQMATASIKSPYQHGENLISYRLNPRTITLDMYYRGTSRSDWFNERAHLISKLGMHATNPNNPETGVLRWEYLQNQQYVVREIACYLSNGLGFDNSRQWHSFGIIEPLTFIAPNPIIYDPTQVTVTVDTFTESLVFPITFPFTLNTGEATQALTYNGTWVSYPVIEIDGPTEGVTILNTGSGSNIVFDYFIQTGVTVTIDTTFGNKSVTDSLGNNLINYLRECDFVGFALAHDPLVTDGDNTLDIQVAAIDATTEVRVKYYNRYYGI